MAKSKELKAVVSFAGSIDPSLTSAAIKSSKLMKKMQGEIQKAKKEMLKNSASFAKGVGSGILKGFGNLAKTVGVGMVATATAAAVALGGMAVQGLSLASDLQEVQNVVSTTFGESEGAINSFAQTALNKFGLTELNAKQMSGTLGAMFKSMDIGDEQMLTMSTNLAALSGDMASFYDMDDATVAFDKIRAGISGETEPLKQIGIDLSVASLEDFAKAQGESKKFADMSQAEQAMLRYGLLMEKTADAQGDFGRTYKSFSNQQKLLKTNFQDLSGRIMQGLLPALSQGMLVLNDFMAGFDVEPLMALVETISDIVIESLPLVNQLLPIIIDALMGIAPLFASFLQSLIPIASEILPILLNIFAMVMPILGQLAEALLPIFSKLLFTLFEALEPLMPLISELIELLMPTVEVLGVIVGFFIKLAGAITGGVLKLLNWLIKGDESKPKKGDIIRNAAEGMKAYANGGFANHASIFGEAGLEAAIPIKPGDPNSLALLARTAALLGVRHESEIKPISNSNSNTYVFEYKPQIYGSAKDTEPMLKRDYGKIKQMFDDFMHGRERVCYE